MLSLNFVLAAVEDYIKRLVVGDWPLVWVIVVRHVYVVLLRNQGFAVTCSCPLTGLILSQAPLGALNIPFLLLHLNLKSN